MVVLRKEIIGIFLCDGVTICISVGIDSHTGQGIFVILVRQSTIVAITRGLLIVSRLFIPVPVACRIRLTRLALLNSCFLNLSIII